MAYKITSTQQFCTTAMQSYKCVLSLWSQVCTTTFLLIFLWLFLPMWSSPDQVPLLIKSLSWSSPSPDQVPFLIKSLSSPPFPLQSPSPQKLLGNLIFFSFLACALVLLHPSPLGMVFLPKGWRFLPVPPPVPVCLAHSYFIYSCYLVYGPKCWS